MLGEQEQGLTAQNRLETSRYNWQDEGVGTVEDKYGFGGDCAT